VAGDVTGHLETRLLSAHGDGPVLQVRFLWIILAADKSFTAKAAGTLNTETGAVVMQGSVVRGFLKDACFLEQGQLVDPIASRFQGSIKLVHGGCD
jgi:hypothetical protein